MSQHERYLADASTEVEIVKDREGRWRVMCYNVRGHFIGGLSSCSDLLRARAEAEKYAISITEKIA